MCSPGAAADAGACDVYCMYSPTPPGATVDAACGVYVCKQRSPVADSSPASLLYATAFERLPVSMKKKEADPSSTRSAFFFKVVHWTNIGACLLVPCACVWVLNEPGPGAFIVLAQVNLKWRPPALARPPPVFGMPTLALQIWPAHGLGGGWKRSCADPDESCRLTRLVHAAFCTGHHRLDEADIVRGRGGNTSPKTGRFLMLP